MVLSTAYCPPVSYFSVLRQGGVTLEKYENYQKQSWRNRCNILTANGVEALQVPVRHKESVVRDGHDASRLVSEVLVDYSKGFMTRHKRAIDSAYMSSAYFEYYRDEFFSVLDSQPQKLWDLNLGVINFLLDKFGIPMPAVTENYVGVDTCIHPKRPDTCYIKRPYYQVFSHKFGFVPNLSAIDLLFNEGPGAVAYL